MLDPDMCWLFLWCLGDGRRGLGIVKLPSLTWSTSSGNAAMTLLPGTPIYIKWQRRKSPCLWTWTQLRSSGSFHRTPWEFTYPAQVLFVCIFVSFSHYFLPVVLGSKKLLHWSQHNCKTSRIYSFPSSIASKIRRCLRVSSFSFSIKQVYIHVFRYLYKLCNQSGSFLFTHNISRSTQKDSLVSCTVSCPWSRSVPAEQFEDDSHRESEIKQHLRGYWWVVPTGKVHSPLPSPFLITQPCVLTGGKKGTAQCDLCFKCCTKTHPCLLHLHLIQQEVSRDDVLYACYCS